MAKDPAFLFYSSDFYTGTAFMTDEQVGKYIRLLCLQHQHGHLTEQHMINICKTYDEHIFSKFEKLPDGKYHNVRLHNEILKRSAYSESRRKNRQSKKDMSNICNSYDTAMSVHMENENENRNKDISINDNESKKEIVKRKQFEPPNIEAVKDYCLERKNSVDAEKWVAYYESNGWMVGRNKMKDWKAAVRTWEKNSYDSKPKSGFGLKTFTPADMDRQYKLLGGGL